MKEITKPNGEVYCWVDINDSLIKIKLNIGSAKGYSVVLDKKIIPQLIEILQEAKNG
jgi:hypothetical protein